MSATDKRLCDTCMNDKCPYGGKGPVIDRETTEMCEHYESMSGSDKLRRLLDERGVEYRFNDATKVFEWHFDGTDGEGSAHATEVDGGVNIIACSITPEQAVAATLGDIDATVSRHGDAGTCRRLPADNYYETCIVRCHGYEREFGYWKCSKCGTNCFEAARYCMNCGAKVVEE